MKMYRVPLTVYTESERNAYIDVIAASPTDAKDKAHDMLDQENSKSLVVLEDVEKRWNSVGLADTPEPLELAT